MSVSISSYVLTLVMMTIDDCHITLTLTVVENIDLVISFPDLSVRCGARSRSGTIVPNQDAYLGFCFLGNLFEIW